MRAPQHAVREAERRFPVRIRIAVPPEGFGSRLDQIFVWLDANCGADGWTSTPSSTRGVINDALALYFADVNSRVHSSPAGARCRGPGTWRGRIRSATTNRHRGSERAGIRRPERVSVQCLLADRECPPTLS
jgi:hypothetical protein